MSKEYFCTFQHDETGMHVAARYERKTLYLAMVDTLEDMRPYITEDSVYLDTVEWCNRHTEKHFETVDAAEDFLHSMGMDACFD